MPNVAELIWLPAALTGGLAGSALTLLVKWLQDSRKARADRAAGLRALRQELQHAAWLIDYNYGRAKDTRLAQKGLISIGATNVEKILFDATPLTLSADLVKGLREYLQQVVYHNGLVAEYVTLLPLPSPGGPMATDRKALCLREIEAICTPEATYQLNPHEPSLRARVHGLLDDLGSVSH